MQKTIRILSLYILGSLGIVLFTSLTAIAETSRTPHAAIDDYVWKVLDAVRNSNYFDNKCEYDSLISYKKCVGTSLEKHDNELSKKWGLSGRILREKDTIYIEVPNRTLPLAFRDEQFAPNAQSHSYFSLYDYDNSKQLLYLLRSFLEGDNIILIDLGTGFNQEFDGIDISLSPDKERIATVERYIGEENISVWQKQKNGNYQVMYESTPDDLKTHLAFYQDRDKRYHFEDVDIEWQSNNSVLIDFYYLINETDDVGYRVRFNYAKPNPTSSWQLIPIK